MNSGPYAIASGHGFKKTIPQRRFRRRVGIRCPLPGTPPRGRPSAHSRPARDPQNGLRWVVRTGSAWRYMPHDLPPWEAVYQQTQRWLKAGVFEDMIHDLRVLLRLSKGRASEPSAAILDSRTLRSTPESGSRGGYPTGTKARRAQKCMPRWTLWDT